MKGLRLLIVAASGAAALAVGLGAHARPPHPVLEAQNTSHGAEPNS